MASCARNIRTKNLTVGFHATVENVWDVFWDTVYFTFSSNSRGRRSRISRKLLLHAGSDIL